ncbi:ABC transporter ATP-binding protein [Ilumatobacter sp.]|uniref:ABC transporter ATP-binding protein n=1 Tax=Ilumatobacter sp. TaxID=1967498 RepID=UPI003C51D4A4
MSELIRLDDVTRRYRTAAGTVVAVDAVSLALRRGDLVGLIGPSGSGKTTILNLILGWEQPDDGTVTTHVEPSGWSGVAVIPQELGLLPELSARENIELAGRLGGGLRADAVETLGSMGLGELVDRFPDELSMGEQQRVAVARAVAMRPTLLVADEPTAHQDERHADLVIDQLAIVANDGGAVIVATHDARLLDRVGSAIQVLDGRIVSTTWSNP